MNGEDKQFFIKEFIALKSKLDERWKNHETRSSDFKEIVKENFDTVKRDIVTLCDAVSNLNLTVNKLPCDQRNERYDHINNELEIIRNNELRHLNNKINALLFTVLGSVFIIIIISGIKALLHIASGG